MRIADKIEVEASLGRTLQLLQDQGSWTQWAASRDAWGKPSNTVLSESARSYCLVGAICRVTDCLSIYTTRATELYLAYLLGVPTLIAWNDAPNRTHQDVLELLTRALKSMQSESPTWTSFLNS